MKTLKTSLKITAVLAFAALIMLFFEYLALSDIANKEPNLTLEWYVVGFSMFINAAFILSVIFSLIMLLKSGVLKEVIKEVKSETEENPAV